MKNYIPQAAETKYERALLREYRRYLGEPVDDDEPAGLTIKVLGQGCPRCEQLTQEVMAALGELGLAADVEHVTDINQIAEYSAVGTPALVFNKDVKSVGRVPKREQIKKWLQEEAQKRKE
ncbi:MAG: thioredoxin family protein [Candidatus Abyssobacteria bacterium SURF_5]|uniref:Thioredoxin family protein n=1 Tax=Abyssobacteria bacterium (strain SURF_5) TaxID=2093360 RepID=A0A3A4NFG8_ABYX5|nr:MAG: thioredoxin family protein [Candidatus Abyssubacteria bacterium SURF_5]